MTRPKEFDEQLAFLVKRGTKERIDAARGDMPKAEFLRAAIDEAIERARRKREKEAR
ncbi:hypothetical protein [Sphingomonas sanxanigenens]|uniref:Uncharacterized protein n=1 Tax=Sphingomonas sanxanigenens DSM 19645 = NX02 TaxID=1123269 RepID=W0AAH5_9SPHN|nr:hypothetical protein [Sphingomonas sanxanigenens]AHE52665.1 hypothetical protein NX02_04610 [Sphingomonas sanxanigenens DSM 19645 = NX02]